jgi:hypothetical protein
MSHVTQPTVTARSQLRAHWIVTVSVLVAFLAATAVTLVVVLDSGTPSTGGSIAKPQAAIRSDGGASESAVAAAVGSQPTAGPEGSSISASIGGPRMRAAGPDEKAVAASIGGPRMRAAGPDEKAVAASIGGPRMRPSGPDESAVAASISGR